MIGDGTEGKEEGSRIQFRLEFSETHLYYKPPKKGPQLITHTFIILLILSIL